jgi:hypothetical protein
VKLHTRTSKDADWANWRPTRIDLPPQAQDSHPGVTYVFDVKAPDTAGVTLSYRFTFIFDKQKKEVEGMKQIRIEAAGGAR